LKSYRGSCHCGRVTFEVRTDLTSVAECNCSYCRRKGALYRRVDPEDFKILSGEDALSIYDFNTRVAKHYFCKYCGIHPFHRPRAAPDKWTVNVRCLDDVDLFRLDVLLFDGVNFEEAVKTFKYR